MDADESKSDQERREEMKDAATRLPILGPFVRLIEYRDDSHRLVDLATTGVHSMVKWGELADAMSWRVDHPDESVAVSESSIALVKRLAAMSSQEIERDFELLRPHALVGLWGAFADFHDDLVVEWLLMKPSVLRESAIGAAVSLPIGEYLGRDDRGRAELVVSEIKKMLRSDLQPGVGQFLPLLNELGLHGRLEVGVKRALLEFQQTRHVWAHKAGVVDQRFLDACPWRTDVTVGSRLHVDDATWRDYLNAVSTYTDGLMSWITELGGDELTASRTDLDGEPAPT